MSNKLFTHVPVPKFPSSTFSLSRPVCGTPRMKKIYPGNIVEIVPGDGIRAGSEVFARAQPMIAPVFSKMRIRQESWFVPAWQLHKNFDDFITGGERADFSGHLPFTTVGTLFTFLRYVLLSCYSNVPQGKWFDKPGSVLADNISGYSRWLSFVVDIIDMFDYSRAFPIKLVDFISPSGATTQAQLVTIMTSNSTAFYDANQHLANSPLRVNILPFLAYQKVWCEFYRDENLFVDYYTDYILDTLKFDTLLEDQSSLITTIFSKILNQSVFSVADASLQNMWYIFGIKDRAWTKDLFTSALPWVQKGPDVLLPVAGLAPVTITGDINPESSPGNGVRISENDRSLVYDTFDHDADGGSVSGVADLSGLSLGSTIVDFRRAVKLQEFFEADGRGGNRYPENTLMQFGVRTPDSRLPRAQFLGSSSQPISVSEVVQTSSTDSVTPQGNLAGKGTSYGRGSLCRKYFTMHGFWLCFFTVDYGAMYEQGIHPMFSRFDRTEYAWPRFAHLGEQPIYTKQLFVDSTVTEDETFGYGPRYVDYKSDQGSIHGLLKTSLNFWTMARRFSTKPVLNDEFIYSKPRQDAFAVSNPLAPPFIMEIDYRVRANRKLPFFGVPMI